MLHIMCDALIRPLLLQPRDRCARSLARTPRCILLAGLLAQTTAGEAPLHLTRAFQHAAGAQGNSSTSVVIV